MAKESKGELAAKKIEEALLEIPKLGNSLAHVKHLQTKNSKSRTISWVLALLCLACLATIIILEYPYSQLNKVFYLLSACAIASFAGSVQYLQQSNQLSMKVDSLQKTTKITFKRLNVLLRQKLPPELCSLLFQAVLTNGHSRKIAPPINTNKEIWDNAVLSLRVIFQEHKSVTNDYKDKCDEAKKELGKTPLKPKITPKMMAEEIPAQPKTGVTASTPTSNQSTSNDGAKRLDSNTKESGKMTFFRSQPWADEPAQRKTKNKPQKKLNHKNKEKKDPEPSSTQPKENKQNAHKTLAACKAKQPPPVTVESLFTPIFFTEEKIADHTKSAMRQIKLYLKLKANEIAREDHEQHPKELAGLAIFGYEKLQPAIEILQYIHFLIQPQALAEKTFFIVATGGVIRDFFLGRTPKDIDLLSNISQKDFHKKFENQDIFSCYKNNKKDVDISIIITQKNNIPLIECRFDNTLNLTQKDSLTKSFLNTDFDWNTLCLDAAGIFYDPFDVIKNLLRIKLKTASQNSAKINLITSHQLSKEAKKTKAAQPEFFLRLINSTGNHWEFLSVELQSMCKNLDAILSQYITSKEGNAAENMLRLITSFDKFFSNFFRKQMITIGIDRNGLYKSQRVREQALQNLKKPLTELLSGQLAQKIINAFLVAGAQPPLRHQPKEGYNLLFLFISGQIGKGSTHAEIEPFVLREWFKGAVIKAYTPEVLGTHEPCSMAIKRLPWVVCYVLLNSKSALSNQEKFLKEVYSFIKDIPFLTASFPENGILLSTEAIRGLFTEVFKELHKSSLMANEKKKGALARHQPDPLQQNRNPTSSDPSLPTAAQDTALSFYSPAPREPASTHPVQEDRSHATDISPYPNFTYSESAAALSKGASPQEPTLQTCPEPKTPPS